MSWLHERSRAARGRGVPALIYILIAFAVAVKVYFYYSGEIFHTTDLENPISLDDSRPHHRPSPHHGHKSSSDTDAETSASSTADLDSIPSLYPSHSLDTGYSTTASSQPPHTPSSRPPGRPAPLDPFPGRPGPGPPGRSRPGSRRMQSFQTERFSAPNISVSRMGEPSPGLLFCNPSTFNPRDAGPMAMADTNDLVWRGPDGVGTNTRVQMLHGVPRLTFWQTRGKIIQGHGYGAVYIMDNSYNVLHKICPEGLDIITTSGAKYDCLLDMHVSLVTDRGTLIVSAYNITTWDLTSVGGPKDGWVYNAIFYEIDIESQDILFEWKSLDHVDEIPFEWAKTPAFGRTPTHHERPQPERPTGKTRRSPWDYFHINSVEPYEDGYLVNSRAMWSVFKIKKDGTMDWQLQGEHGGDFTLEDDIFFSWQHDARIVEATESNLHITLFANDNSGFVRPVNASRAMTLSLDLDSRRVSLVRELNDPTETLYAMAMGNWQALPNNHTLVSYGYGGGFKEFDENGRVIFSGAFGAASFHSFSSSFSVFRQEWHAVPTWPPKTFALYFESNDTTSVWMSWNGATDYDEWRVHVGPAADNLTVIEKVARDGFETHVTLRGRHLWVQVEAMQGRESLRTSNVTEARVVNRYKVDNGSVDAGSADAGPGSMR